MWAGAETQRGQIREAGLELAPGELLAAAAGGGALLEGITMVLLLTGEDDFNALASVMLSGNVDGPVYRLRPELPSHGVVAPYTGGETLFGSELTRPAVIRRSQGGARVAARPASHPLPAGSDVLFVIGADGRLVPVTDHAMPERRADDTVVFLEPSSVEPTSAEPWLTAAGASPVPPHPAAAATVPPQAPAAEPATATVPPQAPAAEPATPPMPSAAPAASPTTAPRSPDTGTGQERTR